MEEEKAIWSAKDKASIEAIEDSTKLYNAETAFLSNEMSEVTGKSILIVVVEVDPHIFLERCYYFL